MASKENKIITIVARDPEGTIEKLLLAIKATGEAGRSFEIVVDPEYSEADGGSVKFYWDGDGQDQILSIQSDEDTTEKKPKTIIVVRANDSEDTIAELIRAIMEAGNGGHGFSIVVAPKAEHDDNKNHKDGPSFYWDGDGSDRIESVESESENLEEAEKKKFPRTYPENLFVQDQAEDIVCSMPKAEEMVESILLEKNPLAGAIQTGKDVAKAGVDAVGRGISLANANKVSKSSLGGSKHGGMMSDYDKAKFNKDYDEFAAASEKDKEELYKKIDPNNDFFRYQETFKDEKQYFNDMVELIKLSGRLGLQMNFFAKIGDKFQQASIKEEYDQALSIIDRFKKAGNMSEDKFVEAAEAAKEFLKQIQSVLDDAFRDWQEKHPNAPGKKALNQSQEDVDKPEGEENDGADETEDEPDVNKEVEEEMDRVMDLVERHAGDDYDYKDPRQVNLDMLQLLTAREKLMAIMLYFKQTGDPVTQKEIQNEIRKIDPIIKDIIKNSGMDKEEVEILKNQAASAARPTHEHYLALAKEVKGGTVPADEKKTAATGAVAPSANKQKELIRILMNWHADNATLKKANLKGAEATAKKTELRNLMSQAAKIKKEMGMSEEDFVKLNKKVQTEFQNRSQMQNESVKKKAVKEAEDDNKSKMRGDKKNSSSVEDEVGHGDGGRYITVNNHSLSYEQYVEDLRLLGGRIGDSDWKKAKGLYARMAVFGNMSQEEYHNYLKGMKKKVNENDEINEDFTMNAGLGYMVKFDLKQFVNDIMKNMTVTGLDKAKAKRIIGANRDAVESLFKQLESIPQVKQRDYSTMIDDLIDSFNVPSAMPALVQEAPCTMCEMSEAIDACEKEKEKEGFDFEQYAINESLAIHEDKIVNDLTSYFSNKNKSLKESAVLAAQAHLVNLDRFKALTEIAARKQKTKLDEAKINLKLTSNTKREMIKKAKIALDAVYAIYDICEKQGIEAKAFMKELDKAFEGTNEMLTVLVTQESVEKK